MSEHRRHHQNKWHLVSLSSPNPGTLMVEIAATKHIVKRYEAQRRKEVEEAERFALQHPPAAATSPPGPLSTDAPTLTPSPPLMRTTRMKIRRTARTMTWQTSPPPPSHPSTTTMTTTWPICVRPASPPLPRKPTKTKRMRMKSEEAFARPHCPRSGSRSAAAVVDTAGMRPSRTRCRTMR